MMNVMNLRNAKLKVPENSFDFLSKPVKLSKFGEYYILSMFISADRQNLVLNYMGDTKLVSLNSESQQTNAQQTQQTQQQQPLNRTLDFDMDVRQTNMNGVGGTQQTNIHEQQVNSLFSKFDNKLEALQDFFNSIVEEVKSKSFFF